MIPIDLDLSGRLDVPPIIPELRVEGVGIFDDKGNTSPVSWSAVICTGCAHCMVPVAMLEHIEPEEIEFVRVSDFRDMRAATEQALYKISVLLPGYRAFSTFAIFVPCSAILLGRSALIDCKLAMNFATGKGALEFRTQ